MSKPAPRAETILSILLDRILAVPAGETAQKLGLTPKYISDLASRYALNDIEFQIRMAITKRVPGVTPAARELNQGYEAQLKELSTKIYNLADGHEDKEFDDDLSEMRYLQIAVKALEEARQARIKIAGIEALSKRKENTEVQSPKSSYEDLLEDDGE